MPWLHVLSQRNEKHFRLTAAVRPDGVPEVDYPAEGRPGDPISRETGHLVKFALSGFSMLSSISVQNPGRCTDKILH